jgi:hypothetical protein
MRSIGFRAEKDTVHWAVVEGTVDLPKLVAEGKFSAPKTDSEPEALHWYRNKVRQMIEQHQAHVAAVRYGETFLQRGAKGKSLGSMFARARIEGVILEAACSSNLKVFTGQLAQISSRLDSPRAKAYLESGDLRGLDLAGKPANRREAILVAVAALGEPQC